MCSLYPMRTALARHGLAPTGLPLLNGLNLNKVKFKALIALVTLQFRAVDSCTTVCLPCETVSSTRAGAVLRPATLQTLRKYFLTGWTDGKVDRKMETLLERQVGLR